MYEAHHPDPRPRLAEDSLLWATLLRRAAMKHGVDLADRLENFRQNGTRLRTVDGNLAIRFERDVTVEAGYTQATGYQTVEQFRADRDEVLRPYAHQIAEVLATMAPAAPQPTLNLGLSQHDGRISVAP